MRTPSRPLRVIASLLAFALIHASFGTQAWAQVVPRIGEVGAPVGGFAAASGGRLASPENVSAPSLTLSNAALNGTPSVSGIDLDSLPRPFAVAASAIPSAPTPAAVFVPTSNDAAPKAALITLQAGPRAGLVANKAAALISGVRAFFGAKPVETVPSAPAALVSGALFASRASDLERFTGSEPALHLRSANGANEPPAPPQPPREPGSKSKGWFGLGALVAGFIGGKLVMQLGLEGQTAAMPKLTEDAFGDFSILAQVAIFANLGSMIGRQLAQFFSDKIGLTRTFYGAYALEALSLGVMVFLLGTGMMPLPLMFAFYAFNGVAGGVALTTLGTLQKILLAQQGVSQQKFRTWWQLLAEIISVPAPMVLGALVATIGASWITALYPAAIIMGLMLFLMLKVLPWDAAKRLEGLLANAAVPAPTSDAPEIGAWQKIKNSFAQIFAHMEEGKDFVFKNSVLKYSLAGAVIFDLMNVLIYRLIAPGYGKLIAGPAGMAAVQGNLLGMFSLGGLLLAATLLILEKRGKKRNESKTDDERAADERGSMLRWMMLGLPALGLLGVMAFHLALPFAPLMLLGINWVPSTALAAALIPFGFVQVAASITLNSYFNDRLPNDDAAKVQKALAFSGSAQTALTIVLLLALKPLFGDLAAFNPFPYLAAALIPLGAAVFFLQRRLAGATKPENLRIVADAPGEKTAGGFAGSLLGVIAAALILNFMAFIPGTAGVLAGLGVLGKFALHLSLALALPVAGWFADRALRRRK